MADDNQELDIATTDDVSGSVPFTNPDASKIKFPGQTNEGAGAKDNDDDGDDPLKDVNNKGSDDGDDDGDKKSGDNGGQQDDSPLVFKTYDDYEAGVNKIVDTATGGLIKSIFDVKNIIEENQRLKQEVETKGKELPFPNEKAKILYDYANKATNFETEAMRQYLHVLTLGDVNKLDAKDAQFEAFHLSRPDLSREKAKAIFEAEYSERYTDLEDNIVQQDRHAIATREAKEKLGKMVEEFNKAPEDNQIDPKQTEAIHKSINDAFDEFQGIKIPFGEDEKDALSVQLNEEEASQFREILIQPTRLIDNIIQSCIDEKGNFDVEAYYSEMYALFSGKRIAEEAFNHGQTLGQVGIIKERRNASQKDQGGSEVKNTKKSFEQTLLEAVSARR